MSDQRRNLNPHKPARAAMWLFSAEYGRQRGGSMDFWDRLSESAKKQCRQLVADIEKCRPESLIEERTVYPSPPDKGRGL